MVIIAVDNNNFALSCVFNATGIVFIIKKDVRSLEMGYIAKTLPEIPITKL